MHEMHGRSHTQRENKRGGGSLMKRNRMKRRRRRCKVRKSAGFQFKSDRARELGIYAKPFMMSGMLTPSMEAICLPA